jgi:DEAD/DEAH box helicase domain-containing protein
LISKRKAIEVIKSILKSREHITKVKSVSDVNSDGLSESVLEDLFLSKLKQISTTWKSIVTSRGRSGFFFELTDANNEKYAYEIEQQIELAQKEHVEVYSKTDFLIYPLKNKEMKPIAVFTDGFSFHEDRIDTDSAQRMAIVRSHKYLSWSLTWEDIEEFGKKKPKYKYTNYLDAKYLNHSTLKKMCQNSVDFVEKTSMELLIDLLTRTDLKEWANRATAISTSMIKAPFDVQSKLLQQSLSEDLYNALFDKEMKYFAGSHDDSDLSILSLGDFTKLSKNDFKDNIFIVHIKDKITRVDFASWAGALRMYNLMQFQECSLFTTQKGIDAALYDVIAFNTKSSDEDTDWELVYEDVLDEAKDLVKALSKNSKIPVPSVGEEIVDSNNMVLGEAELVWESLKVAVTIDETFKTEGWMMLNVNEVEQIIETLEKRIAL